MAKLTPLQKARRKWIIKKRVFLGLCKNCGADATNTFLCDRCHERKVELQRAARLRRKARGVCTDCKAPLEKGRKYRCLACNTKKYGFKICKTKGCEKQIGVHSAYCDDCRAAWQSSKVYFPKCTDCGQLFTATNRGKKICGGCRIKRAYKPVERFEKECINCGNKFMGLRGNKFCPAPSGCSKSYNRYFNKGCESRVSLEYIYYRDRARCHICNKKLLLNNKVPHRHAPTRDHIIPTSKGGDDDISNVKLACFICNSKRGNRWSLGGDQLLLFG